MAGAAPTSTIGDIITTLNEAKEKVEGMNMSDVVGNKRQSAVGKGIDEMLKGCNKDWGRQIHQKAEQAARSPKVTAPEPPSSSSFSSVKGAQATVVGEAIKDIQQKVLDNHILFIKANTSCGKTTVVPGSLGADLRITKHHQRVVCTLPTVHATKSAATFVADTKYNEVPGGFIGYQVRSERIVDKSDKLTKVIYCTAGVIRQILVHKDDALEDIAVLIVDEVHVGSMEIDQIIEMLRVRFEEKKYVPKIVIMSATLDIDHYIHYFTRADGDGKLLQPVPKVDKVELQGTNHGVRTIDLHTKGEKHTKSDQGVQCVQAAIEKLLEQRDTYPEIFKKTPNILVFLPGKKSCNQVCNWIEQQKETSAAMRDYDPYVLYKGCSSFQSRMALKEHHPNDRPKIILATNIAETSLTVSGVGVVIDSGLRKVMFYIDGATCLSLGFITRNDQEQRRGRTGRLGPGLYAPVFPDHMIEETSWDMQRQDLTTTILDLHKMNFDKRTKRTPVKWWFLHKPPMENLSGAFDRLSNIGLLKLQQKLTPLGDLASQLPLEYDLATSLVLGIDIPCAVYICAVASVVQEFKLFDFEGETAHEESSKKHRALELKEEHDAPTLYLAAYYEHMGIENDLNVNLNPSLLNKKCLDRAQEVVKDLKKRMKDWKRNPFTYGARQQLELFKTDCLVYSFGRTLALYDPDTREYRLVDDRNGIRHVGCEEPYASQFSEERHYLCALGGLYCKHRNAQPNLLQVFKVSQETVNWLLNRDWISENEAHALRAMNDTPM